jgi:protein-disulfide isomerase
VAVYFKHLPLDEACNDSIKGDFHVGACQLALGAVCAQEQGRFWAFHDKAFAAELSRPTLSDTVTLAAEAGLDYTAFERCMGTDAARARLAADVEEANQLGLRATPTIFVNGKRLDNLNSFLMAVNSESARLGLPPLSEGGR